MKKFLFLPLLLITSFCFAQYLEPIVSSSIIGKPVKIGNLLVAEFDFPKYLSWDDAKIACSYLGKGWRMPTKTELNILYKNKTKIGGFVHQEYWSSTQSDETYAWRQDFLNGKQEELGKAYGYFVRAVKPL